jgi:hypothetical protein
MQEILVACADVELLKKILAELPGDQYKPIATKRGAAIAAKIAGRGIQMAIVHETLEDCAGEFLLGELATLQPAPGVLYLTAGAPPAKGAFVAALRYPVPGPVLRNALSRVMPSADPEQDLERWRAFYREVKTLNEGLAAQSYFAVLGVPAGAQHNVIVQAFDRLSLRFHPDRYTQHRNERWGQAIFDEVNAVYKVMTEAYKVLADRRLRAKYEQVLAKGELRLAAEDTQGAGGGGPKSLVEMSNNAGAKKFLKLAQADIAAQNFGSALQNLKFALSMEPANAEIQQKIQELEAM